MSKNKEILNRLKRGLLGEGFSQATTILIRLGEIPLLLHYWGSTTYGEWLVLLTIPAYLALFDFGLTLSGAREMTMRISENDIEEAHTIYQSITFTVLTFMIIAISGTSIAAYLLPITKFIDIRQFDQNTATIILTILSFRIFLTSLITLYGLRLYCIGMYGINTAIHAGIRLFGFMLLIAVAMSGGSIFEASEAMLLEGLTGSLFMSIFSRKKVPWLTLGINKFSFKKVKKLIKPGLASSAFQVGNTSNLQGQVLVVGTVLGPEAASIFSIHRTLSRIPVQLFSSINSVFLPELSMSYGDDNPTLFTTLFRKLCQISIWGSLLVCLSMTVIGEPLFDIWTKGKVVFHTDIFYLLLASAFVNSIWYVAISSATATNRHSNLAIYYLTVYGILSVAGTVLASKLYGVNGAPLSLLIAEIAMLVLTLPFSIYVAHDSWKDWLFSVIKPPVKELGTLANNLRSR